LPSSRAVAAGPIAVLRAGCGPVRRGSRVERVETAAADGARAAAFTHGAQVTSSKTVGGDERLFLSERSAFAADAAIRGGGPVIFPQFGAMGPLPKHGFARVVEWDSVRAGQASTGKG